MPSRRSDPDDLQLRPGSDDAEVERLSAELKQQVRQAKQRISERMSRPRSSQPTKRKED